MVFANTFFGIMPTYYGEESRSSTFDFAEQNYGVLRRAGKRLQLVPAATNREHVPVLLTCSNCYHVPSGRESISWNRNSLIAGLGLTKREYRAEFVATAEGRLNEQRQKLQELWMEHTANSYFEALSQIISEEAQKFFTNKSKISRHYGGMRVQRPELLKQRMPGKPGQRMMQNDFRNYRRQARHIGKHMTQRERSTLLTSRRSPGGEEGSQRSTVRQLDLLTPLGRRDTCAVQNCDNSNVYGHLLLQLVFAQLRSSWP